MGEQNPSTAYFFQQVTGIGQSVGCCRGHLGVSADPASALLSQLQLLVVAAFAFFPSHPTSLSPLLVCFYLSHIFSIIPHYYIFLDQLLILIITTVYRINYQNLCPR
jgi:hypothetical protein